MTADPNSPAGVTPERVAPITVADEKRAALSEYAERLRAGVYMNEKHQYWLNGEGPVPSVTTLLDLLNKPAVTVFKAKEASKAMLNLAHREPELASYGWAQMDGLSGTDVLDDLVKRCLAEADNVRDKAANLGSSVHLLADLVGNAPQGQESDSTGFGVDESTFPYIQAYRGFLDRYSASSIVSSEHAVWSLNGYAGTYDLMMMIPEPEIEASHGNHEVGPDLCTMCKASQKLWLIDIKTSGKGPYPEWGLQLAGYRWADYIVLPGDPTLYPMPDIQRTGVLHLRPDLYPDTGWRLIEYPITYKDDFIPFLGLVELWRWRESKRFTKSRLIGRKSKP